MKRIGLPVAVLTVIVFLSYFAGRGARTSDARTEKRRQASATSSVPDFALRDLDGRDKSLGRFKLGTKSQPMNYPILIGNDDAAKKFGGLVGLPTTILISQDGQQVKRIDGLLSYDEMDKTIKSLLETDVR